MVPSHLNTIVAFSSKIISVPFTRQFVEFCKNIGKPYFYVTVLFVWQCCNVMLFCNECDIQLASTTFGTARELPLTYYTGNYTGENSYSMNIATFDILGSKPKPTFWG